MKNPSLLLSYTISLKFRDQGPMLPEVESLRVQSLWLLNKSFTLHIMPMYSSLVGLAEAI